MATEQLRLDTCSASDLATYLLENRFKGDAMETTSFLLECTQTLPDAEALAAQIMGGGGGDDDDDSGGHEDGEAVEVEVVNAAAAPLDGDDDGVSSGEILELPSSVFVDKKKSPVSATGSGDSNNSDNDSSDRLSLVEVSATTPRGKFDLTLHESTGLVLKNKKDEVVEVPSSSVSTVIVFPKAEDCRKTSSSSKKKGPAKRPGNLVLVVLKKGDDDDEEATKEVSFRGKTLTQICFQLPQSIVADQQTNGDGGKEDGEEDESSTADIELEWVSLLAQTFGVSKASIVLVSNPAYLTDDGREERVFSSRYEFKSDETEGTSTTTGGQPFVKCYEQVNDGVLYPLEEGLLFFKPPKFVHRSSLHSIQCGRGGGDSRYVDLVAQLEDDEGVVEFSNIAREEVRVLNDYIHKVLIKAMAKDAADDDEESAGGNNVDVIAADATSVDDDEQDDDQSSNDGSAGRKRSRRAASRDARETTKAQLQSKTADDDSDDDDDDEEGDFVVESESESSTDDDDDDEDEDVGEEEEEEDEVEIEVDATDDSEGQDEDEEEGDSDEGSARKKARTS